MTASEKKTVYLHIGSTKTGTSALQYFLLQNRSVLSRHGFYYPEHEIDANGISSGNARYLMQLARENISQAERLISEMLNTDLPNIILSSEYLFVHHEDLIGIFKKLLAQTDTKIIVYLRRQDSMLKSVYHQQIKRHCCKAGMNAWYAENYKKKRYMHEQVRSWGRIFGKENIVVRPYEQRQFEGGTIFSDFLSLLKLDMTAEYALPPKRINSAYRIDALEAMRLFNILPLTQCLCELDTLMQQFSESLGREGDWPYDLLSPAQRIKVSKYFSGQNAEIARDYLGRADGRLFYDPLPKRNEPWKRYPGLSPWDVRELTAYIAQHNDEVFQQIGQAVIKGLQSRDKTVKQAAKTLSWGVQPFFEDYMKFGSPLKLPFGDRDEKLRKIYYQLPVWLRTPAKNGLQFMYWKKSCPRGYSKYLKESEIC